MTRDLNPDRLDDGARAEAEMNARACTCHPDDNPPVPCAEKYALSDCVAENLRQAAENVANYAWSAVVTDCAESAAYLNELIEKLRSALSALPAPQGDDTPVRFNHGHDKMHRDEAGYFVRYSDYATQAAEIAGLRKKAGKLHDYANMRDAQIASVMEALTRIAASEEFRHASGVHDYAPALTARQAQEIAFTTLSSLKGDSE